MNNIGKSIYAVYGDNFIESVTKEHAIITEKKDGYYLAVNDSGDIFTVFIDDSFNNNDFSEDIGTDYRVFTDEYFANLYFEYLNNKERR